jgi:hypothetical protein
VAMAGQACSWTGVGPSKARPNQSLTVGVKGATATLLR